MSTPILDDDAMTATVVYGGKIMGRCIELVGPDGTVLRACYADVVKCARAIVEYDAHDRTSDDERFAR